MPTARSSLGKTGEAIARSHLESQGMIWVESNWFCQAGEIDIVMRDGDELVFVEVKTRRGDGAGRAEEGISTAKGKRLLNSGSWYLQSHAESGDPIWRIDLVAITLMQGGGVARISHVVNAVVSS